MVVPEPKLRIGDYELVRPLGRGGMGEVWQARDVRLHRHVALKLITPELLESPSHRARFHDEAIALAKLSHERVVTIFDVLDEGGVMALVLQYIDGESLSRRIDAEGVLPLSFVVKCVRDILPALGAAHKHGIIHRDIKPANILVDGEERSFLADFGIAVGDFAERRTTTGLLNGTAPYMSPEQIDRPEDLTVEKKGHRSDIYSFGVVLYEMLTGDVPFGSSGSGGMGRILYAHCHEKPRPLREVNPRVPEAVEAVVMRCLEKNPDDRFQDCADLLRAFNSAADYPETWLERPRPDSKPRPPEPRPVDPSKPRFGRAARKAAWLSLGALLIVAGVLYATKLGNPSVIKENAPPPSRAAELFKSANALFLENKPCEAKSAIDDAVRLDARPEHTNLQRQITSACAAEFYKKAHDLSVDQNKPCEAKAPIAEAVKLESRPEYTDRERQIANACSAVEFYRKAQDLFLVQNKPCEGRAPIDEAVRLYPRAEYTDLQGRIAKGCREGLPPERPGKSSVAKGGPLFAEAQRQYSNGDYCLAKATLDRALEADPQNREYRKLHASAVRGCDLNGQ
jgi:serine/threonine protein kinase